MYEIMCYVLCVCCYRPDRRVQRATGLEDPAETHRPEGRIIALNGVYVVCGIFGELSKLRIIHNINHKDIIQDITILNISA